MKKTQLNKTQNISSGINFQLLNKEIAVKLKIKKKNLGSASLKNTKGTNNWGRHSFTVASNIKVLQRSLSLRPPQPEKNQIFTIKKKDPEKRREGK